MFNCHDNCLGVGINFRNEIGTDILSNLGYFDFIEINTERYFDDKYNSHLQTLEHSLPIVLHGLTLSVGNKEERINADYLKNLTSVLQKVNCTWFSEHLAITRVNGNEIRSLMPIEFSEESARLIIKKINQITSLSQKPFLLENITYYFPMINSDISEIEFINKVIKNADCGLLLDINNLYINSINHCYDPYEFINNLPKDRIVEVHLAGCDFLYDMWVDTHASAIRPEVLQLFEYICKVSPIKGAVIERDAKITHISELLKEVKIVRNIMKRNKLLK